jgi:20S proteasome subunit beta 6
MEFAARTNMNPQGPDLQMWTSEGPASLSAKSLAVDAVKTTPFERRFEPYDFNGGTVVAIAGEDFAVVAGDTRISTGYEILSRSQSKLLPLTNKAVLTAAGCLSDVITLKKMLDARLTQYQHSQGITMSAPAIAQLLSVTLYYRRFFPYYAFCMVGGIDEQGKGCVFGYDAVGSFKRDDYGCMGSGQNFIWPLLDNLIGHKNRLDEKKKLSSDEVISIVKELFIVATERDIYTGDSVEIKLIRKEGITTEIFPLKKD